jgi:hypothetical protein
MLFFDVNCRARLPAGSTSCRLSQPSDEAAPLTAPRLHEVDAHQGPSTWRLPLGCPTGAPATEVDHVHQLANSGAPEPGPGWRSFREECHEGTERGRGRRLTSRPAYRLTEGHGGVSDVNACDTGGLRGNSDVLSLARPRWPRGEGRRRPKCPSNEHRRSPGVRNSTEVDLGAAAPGDDAHPLAPP